MFISAEGVKCLLSACKTLKATVPRLVSNFSGHFKDPMEVLGAAHMFFPSLRSLDVDLSYYTSIEVGEPYGARWTHKDHSGLADFLQAVMEGKYRKLEEVSLIAAIEENASIFKVLSTKPFPFLRKLSLSILWDRHIDTLCALIRCHAIDMVKELSLEVGVVKKNLHEALSLMPGLRSLQLECREEEWFGNGPNDFGLTFLGSHTNSLEHLTLTLCASVVRQDGFYEQLANCKLLRSFSVGKATLLYWVKYELFTALGKCQQLTDLDLSTCRTDHEIGGGLPEILWPNLCALKLSPLKLEELLRVRCGGDGINFSEKTSSLLVVNRSEFLFPQLQSLSLYGNCETDWSSLFPKLTSLGTKSLRSLSLTGVVISAKSVGQYLCPFLPHCSSLRHVAFEDTAISRTKFVELVNALSSCSELQTLRLVGMGIQTEGMVHMWETMGRACWLKLELIDVSRNKIENGAMMIDEDRIRNGLRRCPNLRFLYLQDNKLGTKAYAQLSYIIFHAGEDCPKLHSVRTDSNRYSASNLVFKELLFERGEDKDC